MCRGFGPIVERAKNCIPRHLDRSIIALEVPVVKLVKEVASIESLLVTCNQSLKASMRKRGIQALNIKMEQNVDRMRRDDEMDQ